MQIVEAIITDINDFGLCQVMINNTERAAFMLDKIEGWDGRPLKEFGIVVGARVLIKRPGFTHPAESVEIIREDEDQAT